MLRAVFIMTAVLVLPAVASAQVAEDDPARFQIEQVGEDVLRLDRETGEVLLCAQSRPQFVCRTVVEPSSLPSVAEPAAGEALAQIEELRAQNAELTRRLAMIAALVEDTPPAEEATGPRSTVFGERAREEIDRAVDMTGYAVRRFRDLLTSLTEEEAGAR